MLYRDVAPGRRWSAVPGVVLAIALAGHSASAQSVTAVNPPSLTLQGGKSATLTMFGTQLSRLVTLQVVSGGNAAAGVTARFASDGDSQRRFTLAAALTAVAGQVQVQGRTAAGAIVAVPVALTIQEAPTDADIAISTLVLSVDSAYTGTGISATVTLSAPPLAAIAVDVLDVGTGAVVASGAVPAANVTTTIPVTTQGTGLVKYRARRPPYTTGPIDSLRLFALPQVSAVWFTGPLHAGVANTLNVALNPVAALGGILQLVSSSGVVILPSTVPLTHAQGNVSVPAGIANTTQTVSGTVTATVGSSQKSRDFEVIGTANNPNIASVTPASQAVTGGSGLTLTVTLTSAVTSAAAIKVTPSHSMLLTTPGSITLPAGASTAQLMVTTSPVLVATTTQVLFELGTSSATATVTINPPKPSAITFTAPFVAGSPVSAKVTLDGIVAAAPGIVVTLSSSDPASAAPPATVTVSPGAFEHSFSIPTAVAFASASKAVSINAATAQGSKSGSFTLVRQAGVVSAVSMLPSSVDGGTTATGTVTLDMPSKAGGTAVQLTSSSNAASVPATVIVPEGQSSQTFAISTAVVTSNTNASISANDGVLTKSATLIVQPVLTLTGLQAPAAVEGGHATSIQAIFNRPVGDGNTATVSLASSNSALVVPATATLTCCTQSATFGATATAVTQDEVAVISATHAGVTKLDTVVVRAPAQVQSVTLNPGSIYVAQTSSATVTLNRLATVPVSVSMSSSDPAQVTVPPTAQIDVGQSSVTFPVSASGAGNFTVIGALNGSTAAGALAVEVWQANFVINVPGLPGKDTLTANVSYPASIEIVGSRAGPVALTVNMASQPAGILTFPASVTLAAQSRSAPFTLAVGAVTVPTLVTMTASGGGYTTSRTFVVRP